MVESVSVGCFDNVYSDHFHEVIFQDRRSVSGRLDGSVLSVKSTPLYGDVAGLSSVSCRDSQRPSQVLIQNLILLIQPLTTQYIC